MRCIDESHVLLAPIIILFEDNGILLVLCDHNFLSLGFFISIYPFCVKINWILSPFTL